MTTLSGKTALVTGSTSGIGLGIALSLAKAGANLILNGFGDASKVIAEVEQFGGKVGHHPADVSDPAQIAELLANSLDQHGLRPAQGGAKADLLVSSQVRTERRQVETYDDRGAYYGHSPYGNTYGVAGSVPLRRTYEEHYLIVQVRLLEAASGVEVWSNSAENRSNDDDQAARNKVLRQTIQDALSNYPPAP